MLRHRQDSDKGQVEQSQCDGTTEIFAGRNRPLRTPRQPADGSGGCRPHYDGHLLRHATINTPHIGPLCKESPARAIVLHLIRQSGLQLIRHVACVLLQLSRLDPLVQIDFRNCDRAPLFGQGDRIARVVEDGR